MLPARCQHDLSGVAHGGWGMHSWAPKVAPDASPSSILFVENPDTTHSRSLLVGLRILWMGLCDEVDLFIVHYEMTMLMSGRLLTAVLRLTWQQSQRHPVGLPYRLLGPGVVISTR